MYRVERLAKNGEPRQRVYTIILSRSRLKGTGRVAKQETRTTTIGTRGFRKERLGGIGKGAENESENDAGEFRRLTEAAATKGLKKKTNIDREPGHLSRPGSPGTVRGKTRTTPRVCRTTRASA